MARDEDQIINDILLVIDNTNMVEDKDFILHYVRREVLEIKRLREVENKPQGKVRTR